MQVDRCDWVSEDPLYLSYHDEEWGVPLHDEQALFELLVLEGMQAGLSWITVLRKREHFRTAFAGFHPEIMVRYSPQEKAALLNNAAIIRNRAKIESAFANARAWLELREAGIDPAAWLWNWVDGMAQPHDWLREPVISSWTATSADMSKALKARGFKFVGPVICYAFMQSCGMVDDHAPHCFRYGRPS